MEVVHLLRLGVAVLQSEVYRPAEVLLLGAFLLEDDDLEEDHLVVADVLIGPLGFQNEHHWLFPAEVQ